MQQLKSAGFTNVAIGVVLVLICAALAGITALGYLLWQQDAPLFSLPPAITATPTKDDSLQPASAAPVATSTPAPTIPPAPTPRRIATDISPKPGRFVPSPTVVPFARATAQPQQPAPLSSPAGQSAPGSAAPYIHPTFQPTTQPCETCHQNIRQNPQ